VIDLTSRLPRYVWFSELAQAHVRLVEVRFERQWYRYLTSVIDPRILPAWVVADMYPRRWRIEEAFFIVKRVLNLAYLWTGSENGVLLQVWSTWLFLLCWSIWAMQWPTSWSLSLTASRWRC
jgi:hypothetical protein